MAQVSKKDKEKRIALALSAGPDATTSADLASLIVKVAAAHAAADEAVTIALNIQPGRCRGSAGSSAFRSSQPWRERLLLPIRPRIRADDPEPGAHHPRAERRHRHVIRPGRRSDDRLVVTQAR
jgi:hypothetical protein